MSTYSKIKTWLKNERDGVYSWETVGDDDPTKREYDSKLINRSEGYEVCGLIEDILGELELSPTSNNIFTVEFCIQDSGTRNREDLFKEIVEKLSD